MTPPTKQGNVPPWSQPTEWFLRELAKADPVWARRVEGALIAMKRIQADGKVLP